MDGSPAEWLGRTDVLMELGHTLGNLGQFEAAVRYLGQAVDVDSHDSALTLRAVEQLANYEIRLADIADTGPDRADRMRRSAIARLGNLIAIHQSAERYCLLASAHKRVAAAETDPARARTALSDASRAYSQAHQRYIQRQAFDPYPVLNWLTAAFILDEPVPDGDGLLDRCDAVAAERFDTDRSFFSAIGIAESRLVRALRGGRLGEQDAAADVELAAVESLYRQLIAATAPNSRELNSVCSHIDAVCSLLKKLSGERACTAPAVCRLTRLRRSIGSLDVEDSHYSRGADNGN